MNKIIIIIIVSILTLAKSRVLSTWKKFKLEYNKAYADSNEERIRFNIFQETLIAIKEHNKKYEAGLVSWKQGITPFADWTEDEFVSYLNNDASLLRLPKTIPLFLANKQVPDRFNWRDEGKVSPVKNVAQCRSSWAIDITGAIESQLLIQNDKESLSEQQLIDCTNSVGNKGCFGGLVDKTLDYIQENGIMSENDYPYTAINGTCKYNSTKIVTKIAGYLTGNNETTLKELVATKGPTVVYLDARLLKMYKSGIFDTNTCSQIINWSMLAVGYDTSEDAKDYWVVKGSWGAGWGESGFARMARGKKLCSIGNYDFVPYL